MNEIYGPQSRKEYLESRLAEINPECRCVQSKIVRAQGVRLAMSGTYGQEEVLRGVSEVMDDCPTSEAKGLCCDVIQKCTKVEFINAHPDEIVLMVDTAISNVTPSLES
jgi:hypothetical protein